MTIPAHQLQPGDLAELPSASIFRRLGAMVYDALLVIALALTTTGLLNLFVARPMIPEGAETVSLQGMQTFSGPALSSLLFVQTFVFFAFFWIRFGRTLGMQAWRLRVIDTGTGHNITLRQALRRFLVAIPALLLFGVGYLWKFLDPSGLTWPDRWSGTRVIHVPAAS